MEEDCFSNRVANFLEKNSYLSLAEFESLGPPPSLEAGLLQRLDKGTSGLIAVALSEEEKNRYRKYFLNKKIQKHYLAIAYGIPKQEECDISLKFSQASPSRIKVSSTQDSIEAKVASMRVKVLDSSKHFSLLELITKEGIRHQIRAALSFMGTPILGDPLYCDMDMEKKKKLNKTMDMLPSMQQLHAWKIVLPKEEGGTLVEGNPPEGFQKMVSGIFKA